MKVAPPLLNLAFMCSSWHQCAGADLVRARVSNRAERWQVHTCVRSRVIDPYVGLFDV